MMMYAHTAIYDAVPDEYIRGIYNITGLGGFNGYSLKVYLVLWGSVMVVMVLTHDIG